MKVSKRVRDQTKVKDIIETVKKEEVEVGRSGGKDEEQEMDNTKNNFFD